MIVLRRDGRRRRRSSGGLAKGFYRIRHYSLLARGVCDDYIACARELLGVKDRNDEPTETIIDNNTPPCPCCGGRMIVIEAFERGTMPRHQATRPTSAIRIDTS